MIKRRFFKIDHGDKDGSDPSSSSSDEDYDNQVAEVSHDSDNDSDNHGEVSSVSSGYKSEDSSANEIEANSTEANSEDMVEKESGTRETSHPLGLLSSEDDAGTINEREMLINKELPSESDSEKPNVIAETKPLSADIPTTYVLKFKSVFKCRLCPRIICLTEDTLRNHLQSKRHARSEKLHREGRLKAILNSDGEIEDLEVSENETEDSEDNNTKKNDKGPKLHKKKFKKNKKEVAEIQTEDAEDNMKKNEKGSKLHKRLRNKKNDNGNSRKMRSAKGSSKRSRRNPLGLV